MAVIKFPSKKKKFVFHAGKIHKFGFFFFWKINLIKFLTANCDVKIGFCCFPSASCHSKVLTILLLLLLRSSILNMHLIKPNVIIDGVFFFFGNKNRIKGENFFFFFFRLSFSFGFWKNLKFYLPFRISVSPCQSF